MNFILRIYWKIKIFFIHISLARQRAKNEKLDKDIEKIKMILKHYDLPMRNRSTEYPD